MDRSFDRRLRNPECLRNLPVREALANQAEYLALPSGERRTCCSRRAPPQTEALGVAESQGSGLSLRNGATSRAFTSESLPQNPREPAVGKDEAVEVSGHLHDLQRVRYQFEIERFPAVAPPTATASWKCAKNPCLEVIRYGFGLSKQFLGFGGSSVTSERECLSCQIVTFHTWIRKLFTAPLK